MITCQNIKQMAKVNMKAGKSFIFKASLLLLAISLILSLLVTQLSGINRYMTNINNMYLKNTANCGKIGDSKKQIRRK